MATRRDGNVKKATANTVNAMERSASSRQCPKCGRKSAMKFHADDLMFGSACRWADCGYENMTMREFE